jgi:hypothetical protein
MLIINSSGMGLLTIAHQSVLSTLSTVVMHKLASPPPILPQQLKTPQPSVSRCLEVK